MVHPHWAGAKPGDVIFKDVNDDGAIDGLDRVMNEKNNMPRTIYGFTGNFGYKGFDLAILFQGATGSVQYISAESGEIGNFYKEYADNRWTPENTTSKYPRTWNRDEEYWGSQGNTFWLYNMNYLRLKNFELGYTLPASVNTKLNIEALRFYINGINLLTFSEQKLIDPEVESGNFISSSESYYRWHNINILKILKMKKTFNILMIVSVISLLLSCTKQDEFLDKKPLGDYSETDVWSDPALVQTFVNSMYRNGLGFPFAIERLSDYSDEHSLHPTGMLLTLISL